ncbi:hypothetical protein IW261DRAFT_1429997 [Armillaria novae-zelandiae]|uniref:Alpha/beta hydrolase fold-3 domain-containing protein n=1 Tax=Armillaria novae-zelandiae TaxID=153914 RepID=A0AA39KFK3_9AGAR|nr:hypothetical protein IW261DRAFT_1429997 [Armillaria novae-zelandiae]
MRNAGQHTDLMDIPSIRLFMGTMGGMGPAPPDALVTPVTSHVKKRRLRGILEEFDRQEPGKRELSGEWVVGKRTWNRLQTEWKAAQIGERGSHTFAKKTERVMLYIHGGAYYVSSASEKRVISVPLAQYTDSRVFSLDYRLAPETHFPGPLHDAVIGYFRLIEDLHIPPENIIVCGDSAGGHPHQISKKAGKKYDLIHLALGPESVIHVLDDSAYHVLHAILLLITLIILIVGIFHWEHGVYIDSSQAGNVASYITLGFQIFFTVSVISLSVLSRAFAVDEAIRHPRTLVDLDARIQAWGGLGNVFTNWRGILNLGFERGYIWLDLVSSTRTWDSVPGQATSHQGRYLDPFPMESRSVQDYFTNTSLGWPANQTRDIDMFISYVNNTRMQGLQWTLVHDLPGTPGFAYDIIHVNSTRMQVTCEQPSANVEAFLLAAGTNDTSSATVFDPNSLDGTKDMWITVSMNSTPLYSDTAVNFSTYWDIHNNHSKVVLHPWTLKESLDFPSHHQILFAWATTDKNAILLDSTGRNGTMHNFTVGYVQVFGCSLTLNHSIVGVTEALKLSGSDTPPTVPDRHEYTEFVWEESSSERLANTFLTAFSPIPDPGDEMEWRDLGHTMAEKVLAMGLVNTTNWEAKYIRMTDLESWIEGLFASWVWSIWQGCDYPYLLTSDSGEICGNFHSSYGHTTMEANTGTKTDLPRGAALREARLVEDVYLMVDSEVPSTVKKHGISILLKYGVNEDESHWKLDIDSTRAQGP